MEENFNKESAILRLPNIIKNFFTAKKQADIYKKDAEELNTTIKDLMKNLELDEFETPDGLVAKVSVQNRDTFNEDKLIEKLKSLNAEAAIKTKEYVDMDVLEDLIYNGKLDASELTPCKITKQVVTLKVSERK